MTIRLGNVPSIIVSSPKAAQLFLKTHDANFASRPRISASEHLDDYGAGCFVFAKYGPYWRHVRKLCTLKLLCPSKAEAFAPLRKEEIGLLVQSLKKAAERSEVVDVSDMIFGVGENLTYRMILGCTRDGDAFDFKEIVQETMLLAGAFNIADFLPFLRPFDLQVRTMPTIPL